MANIDKLLDSYKDLVPGEQLRIADIIVEELKENELFFNDGEYDIEKSNLVREFFRRYEHHLSQEDERSRIISYLHEFEGLSDENKKRVVSEVIGTIVKYVDIQKQADNAKLCELDGHDFGEWTHRKEAYFKELVVNQQFVDNYLVDDKSWERKCKRCGFVEKVKKEPDGLNRINRRVKRRRLFSGN